jgi:hypothetical protein
LASYLSTLSLTKKTSLVFILIFTTLVVLDSTIVQFTTYSGVESPTWSIAMFFIFSIIFVVSSIMLLNYVRKNMSSDGYKPVPLSLRYFNGLISATQIMAVAIILTIVFEIVIVNKYSLILLRVQTYLSHLSGLVFLAFLASLFAGWLASKRNYVIILYTISFSLVSINLVVSLIYLDSYLSSTYLPDVRPFPIVSYVTNFPLLPSVTETSSMVFDALSLSSFLFMWVATAIFLGQYRYKMGKIKYFLLMSIPLIYYIFPFQNYFGDVLFSMLQSSPVLVSIIYILIFSATKQVGALLFSLAFWTTSSLVYDDRIRKSLLISSIGMAVLFGSIAISPLQYHVYPPYGLVTLAFTPLGAYLLLIGIFNSAKSMSRDYDLRKEFYKSASGQLTLLKAIGISQMEKEIEKQIKTVEKRSGVSEKERSLHLEREQSHFEEENVKEILRDVLSELYYSKKKEESQE